MSKVFVVSILLMTFISCTPKHQDANQSNSSVSTPKTDTWLQLLDPPKKAECHTQGLVYDRGKDECHIVAKLSNMECTPYNATQAFQKFDNTAPDYFAMLLTLGWKFDQCGLVKGKPIVFLVRPNTKSAQPEIELLAVRPK